MRTGSLQLTTRPLFWLGPLYSALTIFSTHLRLELAGGGWGPYELPPQPGSFLSLPPELPGFFLATVPEQYGNGRLFLGSCSYGRSPRRAAALVLLSQGELSAERPALGSQRAPRGATPSAPAPTSSGQQGPQVSGSGSEAP